MGRKSLSLLDVGFYRIACDCKSKTVGPSIPVMAFVLVLALLSVASTPSLAQLSSTPAEGTADSNPSLNLVVQAGHAGEVRGVAFSPDGRTIASGCTDSTIKVWNVQSGQLLRTLEGHTGGVNSVAFSPDGHTLASGSHDHSIKLWNVQTGGLIRTLVGHTDNVESVVFSPDGHSLASGSDDKTIKLWDVSSGELIRTLSLDTKFGVSCVAFSPNGRSLVGTAGADTDAVIIRLWDVETGNLVWQNEVDDVYSVAFSPDSKALAGVGNAIWLWSAEDGKVLLSRKYLGWAKSVTFSPDGKTIAFGSDIQPVSFWNIQTGDLTHTPAQSDTLCTFSVAFSPDGRTLVSGGDNSTVKLWNVATAELIKTLEGHTDEVASVAVSPDGLKLACGNGDSDKIWNLESGKLVRTLSGQHEGASEVRFSPDGKTLASGGSLTLKLWNLDTGELIWRSVVEDAAPGFADYVCSMSFSSDGKMLATGMDFNKPFKFWDVDTGSLKAQSDGAEYHTSVAFSPDGSTFASGGAKGVINLFNTKTWALTKELAGGSNDVMCFAFSPNGMTLACGSADGAIKLWNMETGNTMWTQTADADREVDSVAFSPDGTTLASGSSDAVRLWDVDSGTLKNIFAVQGFRVSSIAFGPDGKTIAIGTTGGEIRFYSCENSALVCCLFPLEDDGWAVTTPDGRFDGNDTGLRQLHYVYGLDPIDLSQLKDEYYEPGLLSKLMGFSKEPLRSITPITQRRFDTSLCPEVAVDELSADQKSLTVHLTDQGGGIGPVEVYVNGSRYLADARPTDFEATTKNTTFTVDLTGAPTLLPSANTVSVIAYNGAGWLPSRPAYPSGARDIDPDAMTAAPAFDASTPRDLYAIVVGISHYAGGGHDLNYPAQDAQRFAKALTVAADAFPAFGPSRVHVTLLTSPGPAADVPTRGRIAQAFADVQAQAKPRDVFVVYLAGHGMALSSNNSLYAYPTYDLTDFDKDALQADPDLLAKTCVTSTDLDNWLNSKNGIAATYRVMVLDTCAAGAADSLTADISAKRETSSDQLRALDRFQGHSGLHLLTGCAADGVSYEANQYGEGILTYALLKGIKGGALDEGGMVDVSKLFNYAVNEVPNLVTAANGGIQQPDYEHTGAGTFDIGQITANIAPEIPLETVKPILLHPVLFDPAMGFDDAGLTDPVREEIEDKCTVAIGGPDASAPAVFVDSETMAGALLPSGSYTVTNGEATITMKLVADGKPMATLPPISGPVGTKDEKQALADKIAAAVLAAAAK